MLGSGDTPTNPVLNVGWLVDPASAEAVAAVKRMQQAYASIVNITLGEEFAPGPSVQSDRRNPGVHRHTTVPFYQAGATCAMAKSSDSNAVMNS